MRVHVAQEALAVFGIAVGVALLFASLVARTSLTGSVAQLSSGVFGGAQLQVHARSESGFSERLLAAARRLPGVLAVAPLVEHDARIAGPSGSEIVTLIGIDPHFTRLGGRFLRSVHAQALAAQQGLALPEAISTKVGAGNLQAVTLQVGGSSAQALVLYTLSAAEIGGLASSPVVAAPLGYAQQLTGMKGRITRLLVQAAPGAEGRVRGALGRLAARDAQSAVDVLGADADARVFSQAVAPTTQSAELFSAVSALVGFLFAFNAMLLTAPSRRHLIDELHLDGYSPLQLARVLLLDALIVALAGIVLGLLLGELASRLLFVNNPGYLALAFPVGSQRTVTWQCFALAAAGGLLAALVGVIMPLRRELRTPHRVARMPTRLRRGAPLLPALGLICLALPAALVIAGIGSLAVALLAAVLLTLALLLLLGPLFELSLRVAGRLLSPLRSGSLTLALFELRSPATRARCLAVAATGAVAAFGSVAIGGAHSELQAGLDRASADISQNTDVWVLPYGVPNLFVTSSFRDTVSQRIKRLPGVRAVGGYHAALLDWGQRRLWVFALPRTDHYAIPPGQITSGAADVASTRVRAGGWAVVSAAVAGEHGLHVGSRFTLPAPNPIGLRVAALTTNDGWTPGAITVNPRDYQRAWNSSDPSSLNVILAPTVTPTQASAEIQNALGQGSPLRAETASQREHAIDAASRQGLSRLTQIEQIVLVGAALAMAIALAAMIWQRRRRLATMKVDGFEHGELWLALVYESLILLVIGCGIGALFGLYGQLVLTSALTAATGFPVVGTLAPVTALAVLLELSASATLVVALPGLFAARVAPATS